MVYCLGCVVFATRPPLAPLVVHLEWGPRRSNLNVFSEDDVAEGGSIFQKKDELSFVPALNPMYFAGRVVPIHCISIVLVSI